MRPIFIESPLWLERVLSAVHTVVNKRDEGPPLLAMLVILRREWAILRLRQLR